MTIYISGGSNSVLKDGWSFDLAKTTEFTNISIGGSGSAMGAYRAIFTTDLKAGDTLIWEYGVNDNNQVDGGGATLNAAIRYCEYVIRHCMERNVRFIALIMTPYHREKNRWSSPYRKKLGHLFTHYDVEYFDVSQAFRVHKDFKTIPKRLYISNAHYKKNTPLIAFIGDGVRAMLGKPFRAPKHTTALTLHNNARLSFLDTFNTGDTGTFENSIFQSKVWFPQNEPITAGPFKRKGTISAFIVMVPPAPYDDAFDIQFGESTLSLPITTRPGSKTMWITKAILVTGAADQKLNYSKNDSLRISWASVSGEKSYGPERRAQIVGALIEHKSFTRNPIGRPLRTPQLSA